jgi:hypothetical protein
VIDVMMPARFSFAFVAALLASGLSAGAAAQARAQADADEEIDDPKIARRLGTRISWGAPPPPSPRAAPVVVAASASADAGSGVPALARSAEPPQAAAGEPAWVRPRLKLGFRRFDFVRIGASESVDGAVATEPFNSVGIDVYPVTSLLRVGLTTQYGWQSGTFVSSGDYFGAQSLSLGFQYLEAGRVVPFAEAFAGFGYRRRLQFDRTVPTVYWQLGVDAGAEIYFARTGYISVAIGYLRPVNGFARLQQFQTVFVDTWSFKLGIGI